LSPSKAERKRLRRIAEEEAKQAEDDRMKLAFHEKQQNKAHGYRENIKKRKLANALDRKADEKVIA
jgi:hypothetical protein